MKANAEGRDATSTRVGVEIRLADAKGSGRAVLVGEGRGAGVQ